MSMSQKNDRQENLNTERKSQLWTFFPRIFNSCRIQLITEAKVTWSLCDTLQRNISMLVWYYIHSSRHISGRHISVQNSNTRQLSRWRLSSSYVRTSSLPSSRGYRILRTGCKKRFPQMAKKCQSHLAN